MEILKQLYDIGRLFDNVSDLEITTQAFKRIAEVELSYRSLDNDLRQIYEDIRQTALCIATRGKVGNGNFELLQDGIIRVKSFMYKNKYQIENAIIDGARAAYLATSIEKGNMNDGYDCEVISAATACNVSGVLLTQRMGVPRFSIPLNHVIWRLANW